MGFFSDFIGSFTGSNERNAGKDAAAGFQRGIQFTKEQIAKSRAETMPLMQAAFQNINKGLESGIDVQQQALKAQLQLLGAGTEALSPEGPTNALTRGRLNAQDILMGDARPEREKMPFTVVSDTPIQAQKPDFVSPLLGRT